MEGAVINPPVMRRTAPTVWAGLRLSHAALSAFVGDGANRWPAVHRLDAAHLFRLALENAAPGARLHGVAEEGVTMRAIAETIGAWLGVPVRSLTNDEAAIQPRSGWWAQ